MDGSWVSPSRSFGWCLHEKGHPLTSRPEIPQRNIPENIKKKVKLSEKKNKNGKNMKKKRNNFYHNDTYAFI